MGFEHPSVKRDVFHPHVEVGPIENDKGEGCGHSCATTGLGDNQADANENFDHTARMHPKTGIFKLGGDNGLKPYRVREMLNANIDKEKTEENGHRTFDSV